MNEDVLKRLREAVRDGGLRTGNGISEDYGHDESLSVEPVMPEAVALPTCTSEVSALLRICDNDGVAVTARGSGTGVSGGCVATRGGLVLSLEKMNRVKEIDTGNHVAVVEPGVTLAELEATARPHGLVYPILPGESSASIGGNIATNAGGMRAVKYGVTRNNVLGVEAVLASGEIIRSGGKFVKSSTALDLTQLLVGSEGQLAVVTEITLKLVPFLPHRATMLLPFKTLEEVTNTVPSLLQAGVNPLMLEYIDMMTMAALQQHTGLQLNVPQQIKDEALAYLVVVLEGSQPSRIQEDVETVGALAVEQGVMDVFELPKQAGSDLLAAREQAFWMAKKSGAGDLVDVVVPRASMPQYMARISELGSKTRSLIIGCGHAGDGNVHLSIFQPDDEIRRQVLRDVLAVGMHMGGTISAEHGIGAEKRTLYTELEDPCRLALMRRIKLAFDPNSILNPGKAIGQ